MRRASLVPLLNLSLGVAGLGWLLVRYGGGALTLLRRGADVTLLALFVIAIAAALVLSALRWQILAHGLGIPSRLGALCAFRAAGQSAAAVLPGGRLGGEPLRAWYAIQDGMPAAAAVTTVAVDRLLEMASSLVFAVGFGLVLARAQVPALHQPIVGALVGAAALAIAIGVGIRRLRGAGLVVPLVRAVAERWPAAGRHTALAATVEQTARRLLAARSRIATAAAVGVLADLLTLVQYRCLLAAFGLPSGWIDVVAAIFAAGAARMLPVPGAVGTVEAAELWIFGLLGHSPEVGLAIGLVARLRDVAWAGPGFVVLLARALRPAPGPLASDRAR